MCVTLSEEEVTTCQQRALADHVRLFDNVTRELRRASSMCRNLRANHNARASLELAFIARIPGEFMRASRIRTKLGVVCGVCVTGKSELSWLSSALCQSAVTVINDLANARSYGSRASRMYTLYAERILLKNLRSKGRKLVLRFLLAIWYDVKIRHDGR